MFLSPRAPGSVSVVVIVAAVAAVIAVLAMTVKAARARRSRRGRRGFGGPGSGSAAWHLMRAGVVLGISLSLGCEDVVVDLVEVAGVQVVPAVAEVEVGRATDLTAAVQDADGNALGGHPILWESDDPEIATVTGSGRVTGVAAGRTTIRATVNGHSDEAALTVVRPPRIALNRASVVFQTLEGSDSPPHLDVAVTNGGDSPLEGLVVTIEYGGTAEGWLQTSLSGTAAPATLTLATDPAGLAPGQYLATVVVDADRADNAPVSLPIELDVQEAAAAPPSDLTATVASATSVTLAWTDNSDDESEFRIERRDPGASSFTQIATAGADRTSYTDTTVAADGAYVFRVRACGPGGCSAFSNVAQVTTPPNAISDLEASAVSTTQIDLDWSDNSDTETSYEVQQDAGSGFTQIETLGADATSHSVTGLSPNTAYSYRVRACNAGGCAPYSNTATATTPQIPAPAAPSDLTATVTSATSVTLAWTDNSDDETRFEVERDAGTGFAQIATPATNATSYSDDAVSEDNSYTYRVRACNAGGCSDYTAPASATTPPVAASGLAASAVSTTQIDLDWSDNSSTETRYEVEQDAGSGFTQIETLGADATSHSVTGLSPNTTYRYRVRACNTAGCAPYSNTANASTSSIPPPSGLSATTASDGESIELSWSDNSGGETGFEVERDDGTGFTQIATPAADATSYSDDTVSEDHSYTYRVRACNAGGCSAFSNTSSATTPPVAASGLAASAVSTTRIDLDWVDNSDTETSYEVVQDAGSGFTPIETLGADATSHSVTGLSPNTTYRYRVRACNAAGCAPYSNTATATTQQVPAPAAPSGLSATTTSDGESIELSWSDNSDDETRFEVERDAGSGFTNLVDLAADATSYSDGAVSEDHSYTYRVRACNAGGCSDYTTPASATTPPVAASGLAASAVSTTRIDLSWSDNSDTETSYEVVQDAGSGFTPIETLGADATSHSVTGLSPNTTYRYRVRACNAAGCAPYSNTATATTQQVPAPAAPSGLSATTASDGESIELSWSDNSDDETQYEVQRDAGDGFAQIATLGPGSEEHTDDTVSEDNSYTYRVRACNAGGCSAFSNTSSATTPPVAASGLAASAVSTTQIDLDWSDNSDTETSYEVEQDAGSGFTRIETLGADATSHSVTGLSPNTTYRYRVRACNAGGCAPYSNTATATTQQVPAPAAPSGLSATTASDGESIELSWSDNSDDETRFEVERDAGSGFTDLVDLDENATSYSDDSVSEDHSYTYRVRACNAGGCSDYTTPASATTPPAAPTDATASASGLQTIDLTWTDNSSTETTFEIFRDVDGGGFGTTAHATVPADATSYQDTGLTSTSTYTYQVRACNGSGCSDVATSNAAIAL